jgi:uncharacterized membrane protein YcaP (DUF421 family)
MDLESLLFGEEDFSFLLDTVVRSTIMFLVIVVGLRLLGKRGIHQLSVFELGVIIGLGSAAGDPMFYKDVGILPAIVVFIVVIAMYRVVTYLIVRNEKIETLIEGKATYILRDGVILQSFKKQPLGRDEFFATLRQNQVFHLGQVESVIIETDGKLSIFYYPDDKVRHGLPILPDVLEQFQHHISEEGIYSCFECGKADQLGLSSEYSCENCQHEKCVKALNGKRVK